MMKKVVLFAFLLIIGPNLLSADTITLKSGEVIRGQIINETPHYIRIETENDIRIQEFLKDHIRSIDQDDELPVAAEEPQINTSVEEAEEPVQKVIPPPQPVPVKTTTDTTATTITTPQVTETEVTTTTTSTSDTERSGSTSTKKTRKTRNEIVVEKFMEEYEMGFNETSEGNSPRINYKVDFAKSTNMTAAPEAIGKFLLYFLVMYLIFCLPLFLIAKKLNVNHAWLAFIPIFQLYTMVKAGGKPGWWLVLLFIPIISIVISIVLWVSICQRMNKAAGLGFLIIVPLINIIFLWYLALSRAPKQEEVVDQPKPPEDKPPPSPPPPDDKPPPPPPPPPDNKPPPDQPPPYKPNVGTFR